MKLKYYFDPFIVYKKKQGCTDHTIVEYKRFIKDTFHCIAEKYVHQLQIVDAVSVQEAGRVHGYWGEQRAVSILLQFCKFLDESGFKLSFNPARIKLPKTREKEQDFLEVEEFEDLMSRLPNTFYGTRDRCLYELLWSTGLRIGEALAIDIKDINFKSKEIKVHTAKGGEGDKVYISERLEYWLKHWLEKKYDDCPALFINFFLGNPKRYSKILARKNLLNYRKKFGIEKKITHHAFRRGYCTHLLNSGANIKEVQILARHRSERTTLKFYTKVKKNQVKEVHGNIFNRVLTKVFQ